MRRKAAIVFLALLCFTLGLVTAFYFPVPARVGAVVTKLLQGKIRPFAVKRNFKEIIAYVSDRKAGPTVDGNATYLAQYAAQVSYGLITVQVPEHHPAGSPIDATAIKKVESISYPAFLQFLRGQSEKPLVIWIHGYRLSFPVSTSYCAEIARDLDIDANVLTFDWARRVGPLL